MPGNREFPTGIDLNIDFLNRVFVSKVAKRNVVKLRAQLPLRAERDFSDGHWPGRLCTQDDFWIAKFRSWH